MKPSEMSDEELVRAVAREVMDKDLQQSTWWISCKSGSYQDSFIPWNPLTDANHRDMVVEAMRKKGRRVTIDISYEGLGSTVWFWRGQDRNEYGVDLIENKSSCQLNLGRAVCEAALMAVRNAHQGQGQVQELLNPEQADNVIKRLEEIKAGE